MPASITAVITNAAIDSGFIDCGLHTCVPSAFNQTIVLSQTGNCSIYTGELTWSNCSGPLFVTLDGTGNKFYLNRLTMAVAVSGFAGLCSSAYTFTVDVTSCFRTDLYTSSCAGNLGTFGKVIYRTKTGIAAPGELNLIGLSAAIDETDTVKTGYCYGPGDGTVLSGFDLSLSG